MSNKYRPTLHAGADRQEVMLVGLLDLSAQLDCVSHKILINRLQQSFGVRGTTTLYRIKSVSMRALSKSSTLAVCQLSRHWHCSRPVAVPAVHY